MKVGQLLDSLGVELDIEDSDMVTDVVVLAKVVTEDGTVAVSMAASNERDGILQSGLLAEGLALLDHGGDDA